MRKVFFAFALLFPLAASAADAPAESPTSAPADTATAAPPAERKDVLAMPEGEIKPALVLPTKGMTMAEVESKYGAPRTKHPTVGGGSPKTPPITRWDYDAFDVIFERNKVINAVVPGAPPPVFHKDKLSKPIVKVIDAPEETAPSSAPAEDAAPVPAAPAASPDASDNAQLLSAPPQP